MKKFVYFIWIVFFISSCSVSVGKVESIGSIDNLDSPIDTSLQIYIHPKVKNEFTVETTDLKSMKLSEFRESIKIGFENSFKDYFNEITFLEKPSNKGVVLILNKAEPKHFKTAAVTSVSSSSGGSLSSHTNYIIKIRVKYEASLLKNGVKLNNVISQVVSEESTDNVWGFSSVMKNALETMYSEISMKILTPEIINQL